MNKDHLDCLLGRFDLAWCAPYPSQPLSPFVLKSGTGYSPALLQVDGSTDDIIMPIERSLPVAIRRAEWAAVYGPTQDCKHIARPLTEAAWRDQAPAGAIPVAFVVPRGSLFEPRLLLASGHIQSFQPCSSLSLAKASCERERPYWQSGFVKAQPTNSPCSPLDTMQSVLAWRGQPLLIDQITIEPFVLRDRHQFRPCLLQGPHSISSLPAVPDFDHAVEMAAMEARRFACDTASSPLSAA